MSMQTSRLKILFPADFSESCMNAWPTARAFAKAYDAEVVMLYVVEEPAFKLVSEFNAEVEVVRARKRVADFITDNDMDKEVSISAIVKLGKPYRKIQEAALEVNPTWIVMGTHGASGFEEVFMGSNASKVVRSAPCGCVTVRQSFEKTEFKKIALPLDLTKESKEKIAKAVEIAEKFKAELHVIAMINKESVSQRESLEKQMEVACQFIHDKGVVAVPHIYESENEVGEAVIECAEKLGANMICIMTQQESKVKDLFIGSQAEYVVNHSPMPVISVRPQTIFVAKNSGSIFG